MSSIFVLFAILILNGQPTPVYHGFKTMEACQKAAAETVEAALKNNINSGSVTCFEAKIGEFS